MPEEKKKKQTMRYTDEELGLIKNTFAENDDLLKIIRKSMLQMSLSALDLSMLELVRKEGILKVLRKTFLPTLDPEAPIHQMIDLWMTVQIVDKGPDEAYLVLLARERLIKYIDQQLLFLETGKEGKIRFDELNEIGDKIAPDIYVDMIARNTIISHIEMQCNALSILAGRKDETPEETQERLLKDSNK